MNARIELVPTLDHCIETTARHELRKYTSVYLEQGERDSKLEEKIELLRIFLESMDFKALRKQSEKHLSNGKTVRFSVYMEQGRATYEMKVDR